jgi:hypothetical protein
MRRSIVFAVVLAAACGDKKAEGLQPAKDWNQAAPNVVAPLQQRGTAGMQNPHGAMGMMDPNNPHAGMDPNNPHAGLDPNNPHAGLDPNDPHAGMGGAAGGDVTSLGLPAPDPNRPLDPNHRVRGIVKVDAKLKDRLKAGGVLFVFAKRPGPDGAPFGPPVASEKLTWPGGELAFELTDANAMIAGTSLAGDVVVTAHYDQDGDARSYQPGDLTGSARVTIPADNVAIVLDTVL